MAPFHLAASGPGSWWRPCCDTCQYCKEFSGFRRFAEIQVVAADEQFQRETFILRCGSQHKTKTNQGVCIYKTGPEMSHVQLFTSTILGNSVILEQLSINTKAT